MTNRGGMIEMSAVQAARLLAVTLFDPTLTDEDRARIAKWWNDDVRRTENG